MTFELGDRVRIISKDKTGSVCDIYTRENGLELITVDCYGECDSDLLTDCVIEVEPSDLEKIQ